MQAFVGDSAAIQAIEKTLATELGSGVNDGMVNAVPEAVSESEFRVDFTISISVGDPSVSLTPEEARTKLANADMDQLLKDLQRNLDSETGVSNKYQVLSGDGSAPATAPVEMTGLTIVVPEGAATTGGSTEGEEAFAHGQVVFASAQLLAMMAMLLAMLQ